MKHMEVAGSAGRLQVLVIGRAADDFVRYTINLLDGYEVEVFHCEDVYQAVGRLAKKSCNGSILVVGRLEQLDKEQGRFFEKIREKSMYCCCLADGNMRKRISSAKQAGVFIINDPAKIGEIVMKLCANTTQRAKESQGYKAKNFDRNKFLVTEAELDALFGAAAPCGDVT